MRRWIVIFALLFLASPACSEEPANVVDKQASSSAIKESGDVLVTPRGNVYVGMSQERFYDIFQEQYRVFVPQVMLSRECHIFKDWTSKNTNDTITFFINAGKITGWKRGYVAACHNQDSKYAYANDARIDVWFFPKEKAKWNGAKVSLLDWSQLAQAQKVMFITEYINQMNLKHKTTISVSVDKYILGMDYFAGNCPEGCRNIAAGDAINNLLISDGKAKEATQ